MISVGFDISMRSTAIVARNKDNSFHRFKLITSKSKDLNDEALLCYNANEALEFVYDLLSVKLVKECTFYVEGFSLRSKSGSLDLICANHWIMRSAIVAKFPEVKFHVVEPATWKQHVLNRDDLDVLKEIRKEKTDKAKKVAKDTSKDICLNKIDNVIIDGYNNYIKSVKKPPISIYDLSDAYHIAGYGLI